MDEISQKHSEKRERLHILRSNVVSKYKLYYKDDGHLSELPDHYKAHSKSNPFVKGLLVLLARLFHTYPKRDTLIKILFKVNDISPSETNIRIMQAFCDKVDEIEKIRKLKNLVIEVFEIIRADDEKSKINLKDHPNAYTSSLIQTINKYVPNTYQKFQEEMEFLFLEEYKEHKVLDDTISILKTFLENKEAGSHIDIENISLKNYRKRTKANLFDYVAILDQFGMYMPITLIEKLTPKEWKQVRLFVLENEPYETLGIESFTDDDEVFFLRLTNQVKENSISVEFNDSLIFQILEYCDANNKSEKELLEFFCLKKRSFIKVFGNFKYPIGHLIISDKFPSSNKKGLLLRLLGVYYGETGNYVKMHNTFEKCINHIKRYRDEESTAFYSDWANYEIQLGKPENAIPIYHQTLLDFPLPKNKNRTARFNLTLHYCRLDVIDTAISLWSELNYYLLREEEFFNKLYDFINELIRSKNPSEVISLQRFFITLSQKLANENQYDFVHDFTEALDEKIVKNFRMKEALIESYMVISSESALNYINEVLVNIHKTPQEEVTLLNMEFQIISKSYGSASYIGIKFLEKNSGYYPKIIKKIATSLLSENEPSWEKLYEYCLKLKPEDRETFYPYAVILSQLEPLSFDKINRVYENYFKKESTNLEAINKYVFFCIKNKKRSYASKFIQQKLQNINLQENQTNFFTSFLYQQQLKLTLDPNHGKYLLDKSILYAKSDIQKAYILMDYAMLLVKNDVSNDIKKTSRENLIEAIEYFDKSYELKKDEWVLINKANALFYLEEYQLCIGVLDDIREDFYYWKITLALKSLFALGDFTKIEKYQEELDSRYPQLKGLVYFYLAQNVNLTQPERIEYFEKAVNLNSSDEIKLEQAIFYYSINRIKSIELLHKLKNQYYKNLNKQLEIQDSFLKKTRVEKTSSEKIEKINTRFKSLQNADSEFKEELNYSALKVQRF